MAEGQGIVLRMLLEQIGEIGSGSWWLGEPEQRESDDGDDHTDPKQSCRRDESRAAFRASDGRRSLAGKPSSDQERHPRNCGDCVVLLPRGKTEEAYNHQSPQKKKQIGALAARHLRAKLAPAPRHFQQTLRNE